MERVAHPGGAPHGWVMAQRVRLWIPLLLLATIAAGWLIIEFTQDAIEAEHGRR